MTENVLLEAASLYKRSGGLQARSGAGPTELFDPGSLVELVTVAVIPEER